MSSAEVRRLWEEPSEASSQNQRDAVGILAACGGEDVKLQLEQFTQTSGLLAADRHFGLFFIVHFQHEGRFEPRYHFLDVMQIDKE